MDKSELHKLQDFLRRTFGNDAIKVTPSSKDAETADVALGDKRIAQLTVDDEDGDRSFSLAMRIPADRLGIEPYVRKLFSNEKLKVVSRLKKTDSVELNSGPDFIGVVSADDPKGTSFTLQMAILDFDLDEI